MFKNIKTKRITLDNSHTLIIVPTGLRTAKSLLLGITLLCSVQIQAEPFSICALAVAGLAKLGIVSIAGAGTAAAAAAGTATVAAGTTAIAGTVALTTKGAVVGTALLLGAGALAGYKLTRYYDSAFSNLPEHVQQKINAVNMRKLQIQLDALGIKYKNLEGEYAALQEKSDKKDAIIASMYETCQAFIDIYQNHGLNAQSLSVNEQAVYAKMIALQVIYVSGKVRAQA